MSSNYGKNLDAEIAEQWRVAHELWKMGQEAAAYEMYKGLRRDHGVELFYEIEPPKHVRFIHPIGCVLGRASYPDHFVAYQCSGVGSDLDGKRPQFNGPCVLFPGARVLGGAVVGSNVFITANTVVQDCVVPDNSVVFQGTLVTKKILPGLTDYTITLSPAWKPTKRSVVETFFS